jgi:hypothetical protein
MYFSTAMTNSYDLHVLHERRYEVIQVSSNYAGVDIYKIINLGLLSFWSLGIIQCSRNTKLQTCLHS